MLWKRSNFKQVMRSASISTGQCWLKSQEQHSHENTALDAGKLVFQKGADPGLSAGIGVFGFWSSLHQNELRYHHDTHHKSRCLCDASPHPPPPHKAVILISFWQKNVTVLASVRGSFTTAGQNCSGLTEIWGGSPACGSSWECFPLSFKGASEGQLVSSPFIPK